MAYALLSTPVYQSNLLIHVEDSAPDTKEFLGDSSTLFDVQTLATDEIQILRSRLVLGAAVEATKLYIDVRSRYVPLVGVRLARRTKTVSSPGFLRMDGYVWSQEDIDVDRFDVPTSMEDGVPLTVTAHGDGKREPQAFKGITFWDALVPREA